MIIGKAIPGKVELEADRHLAEALKTGELTAPSLGSNLLVGVWV